LCCGEFSAMNCARWIVPVVNCALHWFFLVWGNFKLNFLTFLSLKNLWWDVKSISGARDLEDWKFSYEGQKLKLPNISLWYFFWLQIARWFQKYKNFVVWRSTLIVTGQNDQKLAKFENYIYFDLIWPPVVEIDFQTTKFLHFWNQQAICNQKMYHIDV
jgi:hypothetical protein